ncbi:MAG: L-tyrosine/L-tryptophan isonitrile synthase family protein [Myxococcota bacterium]
MPVPAALIPPARLRILEAAFSAFAEEGFGATRMRRIARDADCSLGLLYRYYPSKQALAVALAHDLAVRGMERVVELPRGPIAERVAETLRISLSLLEAHGSALRGLVTAALDPDGPLNNLDALRSLQARVSAIVSVAILGAEDAPDGVGAARLGRLVEAVHLNLVLLWARSSEASGRAVALVEEGMAALMPMLSTVATQNAMGRLDQVLSPLLGETIDPASRSTARRILERLFRHRRLLPGSPADVSLDAAMAPHLHRLASVVGSGAPITIVLVGFAGRTQNLNRVIGPAPDRAERLALAFLVALQEELGEIHAPGVRLILASDGLLTGDLLGLSERTLKAYAHQVDAMISGKALLWLDLFDVFGEMGVDTARRRLERSWAESDVVPLRKQLDGLQRQLFADRMMRSNKPRAAVRQEARDVAGQILRRQRAWRRLLMTGFPDALVLSSTPQPPIASTMGVLLGTADDVWMTPWSSVILEEDGRSRLVTRLEAEDLGAELIEVEGDAHFEIR